MKKIFVISAFLGVMFAFVSCDKNENIFVSKECSCSNLNGYSKKTYTRKTSKSKPTCKILADDMNKYAAEQGFDQYWVCE